VSALSDALRKANVEQYSGREIARRAGDRVNQATINKYLAGQHGSPSEEVLRVFSEVLEIPMPKLRKLAGLPAGELGKYEPPSVADRLDRRQRRVLNELIHLLVDSDQDAADDDTESTTNITELSSRERMQTTQKKAARSKPRTDS
jgi:transcriptional regulator with XRE-family HTH domain